MPAIVVHSRHRQIHRAIAYIDRMDVYPRSLIRLVVIANALTALPLVVAIGYAAVTFDGIARQSEAVTGEANLAGRLSSELPENLRYMDRILRQYGVLHDRSLLDDYAAVREEWRANVKQLAGIPFMAPVANQVGDMLVTEEAAYRRIGDGSSGFAEMQGTLASLQRKSEALAAEAERIVDAERAIFRSTARKLAQHLLVGMAVGIMMAALVMLVARRLMANLVSRVEGAVLSLGEGQLDRRIELRGPEDVRLIGERLDWLRCRLRDLEEQRTRVLRHISHELKTPLAALREGSSLLSDQVAGALTDQQRRIVAIMHNNALRLQTLIDGLLRLQRAEHVLERMDRVALRFDEVIQQVLTTHQLAARDKQLRMTGTLEPLTITGGREEITTIVNNLVANAIKYSPAGGTIDVSLTKVDEMASFDVFDEGPGVPREDRERIFEPFYRAPGTRSTGGTGLGLAIAIEFVRAHGGSLDLVEETTGAHFRVRLPLRREGE